MGKKIRLKTGKTGIFEEYDMTCTDKAFVILEPDNEAKGSQLVELSDIELM